MTPAPQTRALLLAHEPADATEARHRDRMLALLETPAPFVRSQLQPGHFTASTFVLSPDEADLLLILHGTLGLWLQPGGHVEAGDPDLLAAARREVAEEAGITELRPWGTGPLDLDIHPIPANPKKGEGAHEHFDVRFAFVAKSRELAAGAEVKGARWVPLSQVEDAGTDDSVMRAVRKLTG